MAIWYFTILCLTYIKDPGQHCAAQDLLCFRASCWLFYFFIYFYPHPLLVISDALALYEAGEGAVLGELSWRTDAEMTGFHQPEAIGELEG